MLINFDSKYNDKCIDFITKRYILFFYVYKHFFGTRVNSLFSGIKNFDRKFVINNTLWR